MRAMETEFYEDDELAEDIFARFEQEEVGFTQCPGGQAVPNDTFVVVGAPVHVMAESQLVQA